MPEKSGALQPYSSLNGTLRGSRLTLSYTDEGGTLQTLDFHAASAADYNAAVAEVKAQVNRAQQQEAEQQAEQQLDNDASAIASDIVDLSQAEQALNADLANAADDVATMRQDVATTLHDLQTVLSESGDSVCVDAYQVSGTDNYEVTGTDDYAISNDLEALSDGIAQLRADVQKFKSDGASAPGYVPSGGPSDQAIAAAETRAQGSITSARKKWNAYLGTAKKLEAQANAYADQADAACNRAGGSADMERGLSRAGRIAQSVTG